MIIQPHPTAQLRLYLALALLLAAVAALPREDASTNSGSPYLLLGQAWSSSEETSVSIQDEQQTISRVPSQQNEDIHPFLNVDDLSAEYEYDYEDEESSEEDEDERVRRSLMGRGSTGRGGGRRGGGDVSRRRGGGQQYNYENENRYQPKRAPMPAPSLDVSKNNSPSVSTTSTDTKTKKEKKKKKKKKAGSKNKGLTKELRQEIAQYALQHGLGAANTQYKSKVGRLLPEKVIDKWVQRMRKKQNKHSS